VSRLDAVGFDAGAQDSSVETQGKSTTTTIRFGLRGQEAAQLLARHLDGPVTFEFSTELPGRRVELIPAATAPTVVDDARPASDVPLPSISVPRSGKGTTTTSPVTTTTTTTEPGSVGSGESTTSTVSGSTPSSLDDVTTTTAIGVVPLDAKAAAQCDG
jgi:hypothetical protein